MTSYKTPDLPWFDAVPRVCCPFNIRFDEPTYLKLKWLGTTQYGETMQSIAKSILVNAIDNRLVEMGIPLRPSDDRTPVTKD
jgi:hypothetical protein